MAANIIQSITELPVDDIQMGTRLRPVSKAGVEAIKASITELGVMKDAIHVRKHKRGGKIELLAGAHRLTVAQELDWPTIKVVCWDWDARDPRTGARKVSTEVETMRRAQVLPTPSLTFATSWKSCMRNPQPT